MFTADAHCDTLYSLAVLGKKKTAITPESLRLGKVGLQTFALYAGENDGRALERGQKMLAVMREYPVALFDKALPQDPPDSPGAVLSIEGGEMLQGSLERLRELDGLARVRMVALTWNFENEIGFPAYSGPEPGLKPFGFELLREMDRLGILADVSHLNESGFWDVVETARLPPLASHSNCRWLLDNPRNLTKKQARALFARGGFIGVNFYSGFLLEDGPGALEDVYRHIDALMELGGEKCLGFGSDFDGVSSWPEGLASPADFPKLLDFLRARGYSEETLQDLAGLNLWRLLKRAEAAREE